MNLENTSRLNNKEEALLGILSELDNICCSEKTGKAIAITKDLIKTQSKGLPLVFPHIFRCNCINMANRLIQEIFLIFSFLKRQANLCHVEYNKYTNNM